MTTEEWVLNSCRSVDEGSHRIFNCSEKSGTSEGNGGSHEDGRSTGFSFSFGDLERIGEVGTEHALHVTFQKLLKNIIYLLLKLFVVVALYSLVHKIFPFFVLRAQRIVFLGVRASSFLNNVLILNHGLELFISHVSFALRSENFFNLF